MFLEDTEHSFLSVCDFSLPLFCKLQTFGTGKKKTKGFLVRLLRYGDEILFDSLSTVSVCVRSGVWMDEEEGAVKDEITRWGQP